MSKSNSLNIADSKNNTIFIFLYVSQALTTACMEFEALEDEANAIHGDLWEQLNAGGQVKGHNVI